MELKDLYDKKQYQIILDQYLRDVLSYDLKVNDPDLDSKVNAIVMVIDSCHYCGAYKEILLLLNIISGVEPAKLDKWKIGFLRFEFEALLYYLFNPREYSTSVADIVSRLEELIPQIVYGYESSGITLDNDLLSRIKVFEDYKQGHLPYYDVKFLYPYEPPFGEGVLDLSGCDPYISLTIKRVPREKDAFTSFSFRIVGYTNTDTFWPGHTWMDKERLPIVRKTLPTLNLILLRAMCAAPGKYVPLYNIEQVSSVSLALYTYDGTAVGQTLSSTFFDAAWAGGNVPTISFNAEEFELLSKDIHSHYDAAHFFMQFYQAKNAMNAGMYVESFLMFCTAAESMLYWWIGHIAELSGANEAYHLFSQSKITKCSECMLLPSGAAYPDEGRYPNVFQHIRFLKDQCGITNAQKRALAKCISTARNNELRNDVVHGRINSVSLAVLKQAEEAIMQMQSTFVEIENEIISKTAS